MEFKKRWALACKQVRKGFEKAERAEQEKAHALIKIDELQARLLDWYENKKVLPSKLHHLKEEWKKIALHASQDAIESYGKVMNDYENFCAQAEEADKVKRERVEELIKGLKT